MKSFKRFPLQGKLGFEHIFANTEEALRYIYSIDKSILRNDSDLKKLDEIREENEVALKVEKQRTTSTDSEIF